MATFEEQYKAAVVSGEHRLRTEPHIEKAHYDAKLRRVIVSLSNHAWFAFRPEDAQGLENATTAELKKIEISPSTFGLHISSFSMRSSTLQASCKVTSVLANGWLPALALPAAPLAAKPKSPPPAPTENSAADHARPEAELQKSFSYYAVPRVFCTSRLVFIVAASYN